MGDYEVCINQTEPGGGKRYSTVDDAATAAEDALDASPDPSMFVTIHEHHGSVSVTIDDSRWPLNEG
jgi:hypothetical protein